MSFRRLFVALPFVIGAALAIAAENPAPRNTAPEATPKPAAAKPATARGATRGTPAASPSATPEKKRSFFSRMFGPKATPAPPTPTPRPVVHRRKPADDDDDEKPSASERKEKEKEKEEASNPPAPETAPNTENKGENTSKTEKNEGGEKGEKADKPDKEKGDKAGVDSAANPPAAATPAPKKGSKGSKAATTLRKESAPTSDDPEEAERLKFAETKTRADADKNVAALREKADNATSDEESRKAMRAYNKALFEKMRSLEPSLDGRINRMEAAVMKQLDAKVGGTEQ